MPNRATDWFRQAQRDLEMATNAQASGHHEWACFAAQQAAEMAVKGLHLHLKQDAWGHVVARLVRELPPLTNVPVGLVEKAKVLDNYYVPTRYANGHAEGAPYEHYGPVHSQQAIAYAREILEFVRSQMA